jgi:hypothetical protein
MYGKVTDIHRKTIAELIRSFIQKLPHVFNEVVVVAGKPTTVLQRRADFLNSERRLVIRAGNEGSLQAG